MTNDELLIEDNIFSFRGKKYKWQSLFLVPSITMKCIDDGELFSFGFDAPIRDEFQMLEDAKCQ